MSPARPPEPAADEPRDARLQAALRQAPDHALQPPAALAQSIRAAAHAAVKPPAPRPWWAGLQRAWQAIAAPRPVWAGATAALLVSVLTVRLWVDEPLPPAVEATAPAAPAAAPVAPAPTPAVADRPRPSQGVSKDVTSPPAAAAKSAPAKSQAQQNAATPSPAVASPEPIAAPKAEAREARAAEDAAAAAPARNDLARQRAPAPAPAAAAAPPPAPAAMGLAKALAPQRPGTLDAWLLAARSETDDSNWPITAQQRRLLRLLRAPDAARWAPAPPASAPQALAERDAAPLIWPSPRGTATLQLEPTGLRWTEPDGSVWILPLSAEQLQRLRQAL